MERHSGLNRGKEIVMMNRKKKIGALVIVGFFCIAACIFWWLYKQNQRFSPLPQGGVNPNIADITWMSKGTVTEEDTCLIVKSNANSERQKYYYYFNVIPGESVFFVEREGKKEILRGDGSNTREKIFWKDIQTKVYDITSSKLVQCIDVKELVEKYAPGYQYDGSGANIFTEKNGHIFFRWGLSDIPEDGNQEQVLEFLCMDYETGEIDVKENFATTYSNPDKQEDFIQELYNTNWEAFMKQNGFTEFGEEETGREFEYMIYRSVSGFVNINISTSALPKENEALYSRFPGLQEYQGKEGEVVRVFLGGYPTAEEIQQLFIEEATE